MSRTHVLLFVLLALKTSGLRYAQALGSSPREARRPPRCFWES